MTNEHIANAIRLESDNNKLHEVIRKQSSQIKRLEDEVKILKQRLDEKWIAFND